MSINYEVVEAFLMNYRSIRENQIVQEIDIGDNEYMFFIDDGSRVRFDMTNYAMTYIAPREELSETDMDDIWRKEFARKLKKKLITNRITQKELASELQVTDRTIRNYINKVSVPDMVTIRKMSRIFGCSVDDLINFDYMM